ncbi:hypothetical protein, partial [Thermanaerothrix sp.]|uniref:hypothetical protein n=1 Tax=Thermanaerothrix sp. TaxID=2972675 RepID=UPI002ADDA8AD
MNIASLLQGFASLVWLLLIALVVLSIVRAAQNRPLRKAGSMILVTAAIAVVSSLIAAGLVFIEPQERGVVIS